MNYLIFQELIYRKVLSEFEKLNDSFYERAMEIKKQKQCVTPWRCDTYNTLDTHNLKDDPLFQDLLETISSEVVTFAKSYGVENKKLKCSTSWLNISEPGNFQENHIHENSHFSAVYYVRTPENCGNLVLRSHGANTDMFPLPVLESDIQPPYFKTFFVIPQQSNLIIFRSNLSHMVEKNMSNENRISIASNFYFVNNDE